MHVTGGQYKGHKIITPDCARPTLSKTRESVFNILFSIFESEFENKIFLDLFAGSGIMSLEAASRGYKSIAIDKSPKAIKLIKENLKIAENKTEIILSDSMKFLDKTEIKPDVVYLDPPWDMEYEPYIIKVEEKFKNCIIIIEYDKKRAQKMAEFYATTIAPFKNKVYGRSVLDFIKV